MPEDKVYLNMWEGEPFFGIDRRNFARLNTGMIPAFEYKLIRETDRYEIFRDGSGIVRQALKAGTVRGTRMSMDTYLEHPVKDRASWQDVKRRYDPTAPVRYPVWWDELARLWKDRDYPVCLLGNGAYGLYSGLRSWVGTENISYMFYDDPAPVEEMIEFRVEFLLGLVERALQDVQFDYFNFFEDCAGKGGPLFGPELYRKFALPRYRRVVEFCRGRGIEFFCLDSDGDITKLIPIWVDAGINILYPFEVQCGMDVVKIRKEYGPDLRMWYGIDKRALAHGPEAIDAELARVKPLVDEGGYVPGTDHSLPPDISFENYRIYMQKLREIL